jgi:hypothetical protein
MLGLGRLLTTIATATLLISESGFQTLQLSPEEWALRFARRRLFFRRH